MALTSNTKIRHTYQQTGDIHESVLDLVVDTAPMAVPLLAMAGRGPNPLSTRFEWVLDYSGPYPVVGGLSDLVRGEGDDADPKATAERTRLHNDTHIWGRSWSVSHTAEVVDAIGIDSEFDYQAAKNARLVVRDMNFLAINAVWQNESGTPNDGVAASVNNRTMGGIRHQMKAIGQADSGTAEAFVTNHGTYVGADGTPVGTAAFSEWESYIDSAAENLTTTKLNTAMKTIWSRGGLGSGVMQVLANGTQKQKISTLYAPESGSSGIHRRDFGSQASTEVVLPVDVVVSDFGEMHVHLDQAVPTDDVIGFDPEFFNINVLRDFELIELAKTGPSQHGMIEAEMTCSLLAPNTAFLIEDIT